ncbi:MAG: hypothetical protein LBD40_03650 [Puniceicoccales bacterium]|nr:hypothetical protein [Puniceicoccales bacterium]
MGIKLGSVGLFVCGIILSSKTSWAEEIFAIPYVPSGGLVISSADAGLPTVASKSSAQEADKTSLADASLSTVASVDPSKEADSSIDRQEIKADKKEVIEDETIIEAWARDLSQKALKCLEEDETRIGSFMRSVRGILWVVPETLGTLLGVQVGSALGFYRKSDGHWGPPFVCQVEAEAPIKWNETKLLVIPIEDEKTQVSMLLPQWSYAMEMVMSQAPIVISQGPMVTPRDSASQNVLSLALEKSPIVLEKNLFWAFPESKDFYREMKLSFHFNREINEELYGIKNIRAIDIVFDSSIPPCLRALWNCLEAFK